MAYVKLNPAVIIGHTKALEQTTAKYPLNKSVLKSVVVPKDQLSFVWDSVFQNDVPEKIVVGLVAADSFGGTFQKSACNFRTFGLSSVSVFVDGQHVRASPVRVSGDNIAAAYVNLFEGVGTWGSDVGNDIDRSDFKDGRALFVFALSPSFPEQDYLNLTRQGNLRIQLQFSKALKQNINVVVYGQFSGVLEVDQTRRVIFSNVSA